MVLAVDTHLREFNRYTGDGLPNEPIGAPLPIGDPASGVYNPRKADLRDAINAAVLESQDAADAAILDADRAEAAALTVPLYRQAFADLAAITPAQLSIGADVETPFGSYRRVASGGHLDYSGAGGVRLDRTSGGVIAVQGGVSPSYKFGFGLYAQMDATLIASWAFDGADGFANKIGINNTNPVTGTWTADTGYTAGRANYSAIPAGYDNVANGLASMVASMHSMVYSAADHGTIYGGSVNAIEKGSYSSVFAGTNNRVTALRNDGMTVSPGTNSHILGGRDNRVTNANGVAVGGQSQIVDGEYSSAIGGSTNRALGNFDHVAGSNNEARRGTLGAGQKNTIGGGRYNIIDSVTNPTSNTIGGGEDHEVYGSFNTIGGGDNCTIGQVATNSSYAVIGGGLDNTVTGLNAATIAGGRGNSVTLDYGSVFGGRENIASGNYATVGGYQGAGRHDFGLTYGAGYFAAVGDAQSSVVLRKTSTTNATVTSMGAIVLPDNSTFFFTAYIVARRSDATGESAAYKIEGCIDRNTGTATTALVGAITKTVIAEDTVGWDVTAIANTASGGLTLQVTGEAAKTIRWVANVTLVEVSS